MTIDNARLDRAARELCLRLVVVFGSRAPGEGVTPQPDSDLDIGVVAGERRVSLAELYGAFRGAFPGQALDLAILNDADPLFRYEVFQRSELLYGDPDLYAEYQAYAYRDFMDSADLRALEDTLSRKKLHRLLDASA